MIDDEIFGGEHPKPWTPEQKAEFAKSMKPVFDSNSQAFQARVKPWMLACFGEEVSNDKTERNHRFLEEALEFVQSTGCTINEAYKLVHYVFNRPVGEPHQEVGGTLVTLAAACLANGIDMHDAGETELARIWTKVEAIRAKQASKPRHSPLPTGLDSTDGMTEAVMWHEGTQTFYRVVPLRKMTMAEALQDGTD